MKRTLQHQEENAKKKVFCISQKEKEDDLIKEELIKKEKQEKKEKTEQEEQSIVLFCQDGAKKRFLYKRVEIKVTFKWREKGKTKQKIVKIEQGVSPFNKNKEGKEKNIQEITSDLDIKAENLYKQFCKEKKFAITLSKEVNKFI